MKIYNELPLLIECLTRWKTCPSARQFATEFAQPMQRSVGDFFEGFDSALSGLNWKMYRDEALRIDPAREEIRFRKHLKDVEDLF